MTQIFYGHPMGFFYLLSCSDFESEREDDKTTRYKSYSNTILFQAIIV